MCYLTPTNIVVSWADLLSNEKEIIQKDYPRDIAQDVMNGIKNVVIDKMQPVYVFDPNKNIENEILPGTRKIIGVKKNDTI